MNISLAQAAHNTTELNQDLLNELRQTQNPPGGYPEKTFQASNGGDHTKLRGIPAIGRGVAGHIPGSNPAQIANNRWA